MTERSPFLRLVPSEPRETARSELPTSEIHGSSGKDYLNRNICQRESIGLVVPLLKRGDHKRRLPKRAGQLKTTEPKERDPRVSPDLWPLPQRVAMRGNELGLTQKTLALAAGCKQPKISKLLRYKDLHTLDAMFVIGLTRALQMSADELLTGRRPRIVFDDPAPLPSQEIQPRRAPEETVIPEVSGSVR